MELSLDQLIARLLRRFEDDDGGILMEDLASRLIDRLELLGEQMEIE